MCSQLLVHMNINEDSLSSKQLQVLHAGITWLWFPVYKCFSNYFDLDKSHLILQGQNIIFFRNLKMTACPERRFEGAVRTKLVEQLFCVFTISEMLEFIWVKHRFCGVCDALFCPD